jgi:hypothetical protein
MITWWLTNQKMTVMVVVQNTKIIDAAPIVRKFIGQPFQNIVGWMSRIAPGFQRNWLIIEDDDGNIVLENKDFLAVNDDDTIYKALNG